MKRLMRWQKWEASISVSPPQKEIEKKNEEKEWKNRETWRKK